MTALCTAHLQLTGELSLGFAINQRESETDLNKVALHISLWIGPGVR
jgi:hypothetical protein